MKFSHKACGRLLLVQHLCTRRIRAPASSRTAAAACDCEASRPASSSTGSSSRWLPAASVGVRGSRSGEWSGQTWLTLGAAGVSAGAGAMELRRSDGVACCDGLEHSLFSPMGKLPASQLSQPTFFLSEAYRRRIFFNYERRLRLRSPPEKVFEYFSSVRNEDGHTFMTAADLMRAIVPVFPPSGSHLVREGYLGGESSPGDLQCLPRSSSRRSTRMGTD